MDMYFYFWDEFKLLSSKFISECKRLKKETHAKGRAHTRGMGISRKPKT
jgi:hypothetical protein